VKIFPCVSLGGAALVVSGALAIACGSKHTEPALLGTTGSTGGAGGGGGSSGSGSGTGSDLDGSIAGGIVADASITSLAVLPAEVVSMYTQAGDLLFAVCSDGTIHSVDDSGVVTTIGTAITGASQIAADSSAVYVLAGGVAGGNNGSILRIDRSLGTTTTLASGLLNPSALVTDASYVYWLDGGIGTGIRVSAVPLGGGTTTTLATYPSFGTPGSLSVSGGVAYFTDTNGNEAELLSAYIDSGTVNNVATLLGETPGATTGLAVNDVDAFMTTGGNAGALVEFVRADAGLPVTTLVTAQTAAIGLRFLGTELVWVDSTSGALMVYDTLSGEYGTITTGFPSATATAVGASLYVAYNNGVISTVSFD
jgi:hypothetical protein